MKSSPPKQHEYDIFADPRIPEVLRAWAKLNYVEWGGKIILLGRTNRGGP